MKLRIPPVLVAAIFGLLMWSLDQLFSYSFLKFSTAPWISKILLASAVVLAFASLFQFSRNKTTIDPHRPDKASALVTSGIYRLSRNPMYLAILLLLIGFGLKLENVLTFIPIPAFIWYMNCFQIIPEEEMLAKKFGQEFEAYKSKVRRWL